MLCCFPQARNLSSVVNTGASHLNSLALVHLPWSCRWDPRLWPLELMETRPCPQSHPAEHQAEQLLGESRSTLRLHEAVAGHLSPRAGLPFPILGHSLAPGLGTAGSIWLGQEVLWITVSCRWNSPGLGADLLGWGCLSSHTYRQVPKAVCFCAHGCVCTYMHMIKTGFVQESSVCNLCSQITKKSGLGTKQLQQHTGFSGGFL